LNGDPRISPSCGLVVEDDAAPIAEGTLDRQGKPGDIVAIFGIAGDLETDGRSEFRLEARRADEPSRSIGIGLAWIDENARRMCARVVREERIAPCSRDADGWQGRITYFSGQLDLPQDFAAFTAEVEDGVAWLAMSAPSPVRKVASGTIRVRWCRAAIEVGR
jgi:hypothetical protein